MPAWEAFFCKILQLLKFDIGIRRKLAVLGGLGLGFQHLSKNVEPVLRSHWQHLFRVPDIPITVFDKQFKFLG